MRRSRPLLRSRRMTESGSRCEVMSVISNGSCRSSVPAEAFAAPRQMTGCRWSGPQRRHGWRWIWLGLVFTFLGQAGSGAGQQKQKSQKYPHRCTSFFGESWAAESGEEREILCQIGERRSSFLAGENLGNGGYPPWRVALGLRPTANLFPFEVLESSLL